VPVASAASAQVVLSRNLFAGFGAASGESGGPGNRAGVPGNFVVGTEPAGAR
jgi:hypothetical protein